MFRQPRQEFFLCVPCQPQKFRGHMLHLQDCSPYQHTNIRTRSGCTVPNVVHLIFSMKVTHSSHLLSDIPMSIRVKCVCAPDDQSHLVKKLLLSGPLGNLCLEVQMPDSRTHTHLHRSCTCRSSCRTHCQSRSNYRRCLHIQENRTPRTCRYKQYILTNRRWS